MDAVKRRFVRSRADNHCEYCLLKQDDSALTHHIEHIVARQHGGSDEEQNLALACHRCNLHKDPNLTALDPNTGDLVPLFHPRRQLWGEHFQWVGVRVEGITDVGRATVHLLRMNDARRLEQRGEIALRHSETD